MELEVDKKEFERIQQELIQATAKNITLEYFEYEGKKWLNEDFVIPISVIQNRLDELDEQIKEFSTYVNESTGEEKQYWKRERAELVGARGALLGLLKIERNK